MKENVSKVNCWDCAHFAISWDQSRRYQCNKLGFKSRNLPSIEVYQADGRQCMSFVRKEAGSKKK